MLRSIVLILLILPGFSLGSDCIWIYWFSLRWTMEDPGLNRVTDRPLKRMYRMVVG